MSWKEISALLAFFFQCRYFYKYYIFWKKMLILEKHKNTNQQKVTYTLNHKERKHYPFICLLWNVHTYTDLISLLNLILFLYTFIKYAFRTIVFQFLCGCLEYMRMILSTFLTLSSRRKNKTIKTQCGKCIN
jgi:hypothetical protein